jgi:uncharacterized protein YndB with AHSA1/START domain
VAPFVSTFEIGRPPEEVFAYAADPANFPEWQDDVVRVQVGGSRFTTTRRIGRVERTMTQEITENSPPRRWAVRGVGGGPLRANATMTVEPIDGGTRSRVTMALDFQGRGIGRLIVPLVVRPMAAKGAPVSYRHLKERLESGA